MFALDLVYWCVTVFTLLTLVCSISFVTYFAIRKTFEILLTVSPQGPNRNLTRRAESDSRVAWLGARVATK
jgi:hypothetical protein